MPSAPLPRSIERIGLGRKTLYVSHPNTGSFGHLALEVFQTLSLARAARAVVVFAVAADAPNPALVELDADGVTVLHGLSRALALSLTMPIRWWRGVVQAQRVVMNEELKRRLGEAGVHQAVRKGFKERRRRLRPREDEASTYFRRRLLRDMPRLMLREEQKGEAAATLRRLGIADSARVACIHAREAGYKRGREVEDKGGSRADAVRNASIRAYDDAVDCLIGRGFTVVRLGDPTMQALERDDVVDLACSALLTPLADVACLLRAELVIAGESGPAAAALAGSAAILTVNVTDALSSYPVVERGFMLAKTITDRRTGGVLSVADMLEDEYYGNLRDATLFSYADNTADEIRRAVDEVLGWLDGRPETPTQARFRARATRAAQRLTSMYPYAHKWGTDDGFLGDGRVVDFQLEAVS